LVRLGLSVILSKFSPLTATARRVRLPVTLDHAGGVTIDLPAGELPAGDNGFAFENAESVQAFEVFGYHFECPVKRTFFKSTTIPVGLVSAPRLYCIGSQGFLRSGRSSTFAMGQVALSLRGQWVVGIKDDAVQQLADGAGQADAELVAFLEPYEIKQPREQLSELALTIASSSFASQFLDVIKSARDASQPNGTVERPKVVGPRGEGPGPGTSAEFDYFGSETVEPPKASPDVESEDPETKDKWDPFI
jgi:hypothetical protein